MTNLRKLTYQDAKKIREAFESVTDDKVREFVIEWAAKYGVGETTIRRIVMGITYLTPEQMATNQYKYMGKPLVRTRRTRHGVP